MEITVHTKGSGFFIRILAAICLTIGGFFSLAAGDWVFSRGSESLTSQILVYIIPIIYITSLHRIFKKHHFINESFFAAGRINWNGLRTFLTGALFMLIPLGLSVLGNVLPYIGKNPVSRYPVILVQLILLNLLIGLFEEGLFRHLIFKILWKDSSRRSLLLSFFLSSLLFGVLHFGNLTVAAQKPIAVTTQVLYAFFLGMLFAGLYLRYHSFLGIAVLHGFVDFITSFPRLYGQPDPVTSADITLLQGIATAGILLPSGLLGILLLRSFIKRYPFTVF